MVATKQSSTPTYLRTPRGTLVPRVVTQDWLNLDPERNPTLAEVAIAWHAVMPMDDGLTMMALMDVVDAIQDGGALVVQYRNEDGIVTARCLFPSQITLTEDRHIAFRAWCSSRKTIRTFRCDRVLNSHALVFPFEMAA